MISMIGRAMGDAMRDVLELPWPVVAVATVIVGAFTTFVLVSISVFGLWLITRVPPFAWVLRRALWGMFRPLQEYAEGRVRDIVVEEVAPIREQMQENGGGSLRDRVDQAVLQATKSNDRRARVEQELSGLGNRANGFDDRLRDVEKRVRDLMADEDEDSSVDQSTGGR